MLERMEERSVQLQALSERATNVQEEERKRIARGLHDDTGQALSTLIFELERLEGVLPADAPELKRRLAATRKLAVCALDDLRKVVYDLRPTMLDDLGLAAAIRWYARAKLEEGGIQVRFERFDEMIRLAPEVETALFRIAQEAISNILHHADAKLVALRLGCENGYACLEVEDNGCGFDVATVTGQALRRRRFGLLGIQERADWVGGEVALDSEPGQGTCLRIRVPMPAMEQLLFAR
jgi:signal transduction histidine kinase